MQKGNKEKKTSDHNVELILSSISSACNKVYQRKRMVTHISYIVYENYYTLGIR